MPKIKITEIDQTGQVQPGKISNVVFLPIKTEEGITTGFTPTLVSSAAELMKMEYKTEKQASAEGTNIVATGYFNAETNAGYRMAKHLIAIGFQVLVQGVTSHEEISWADLQDKSLYDVRFLTNGFFPGIPTDMITAAQKRGDCIALCNIDESSKLISTDNDLADTTEVSFDYSDLEAIRGAFESAAATGGAYAAGFTPWFITKSPDLVTSSLVKSEKGDTYVSNAEEKIPAAFGYLFAYANAIRNNPEWFAIAGFERGIIPELDRLCYEYSGSEIEILQGRSVKKDVELDDEEDNVGVAINPIASIRPAGPIIYGNRTLKVNDANKKCTATSFLNVRNMVSAIKKHLYNAARKYTFEQNSTFLWVNFKAYVRPLLESMQYGNGLLSYSLQRLDTPAKGRLKARLSIVPVEAVEDFEIEVLMSDDITVVE